MLACQLERGEIVLKSIEAGNLRVRPLVLRVAGSAAHALRQIAVQRAVLVELLADVGVTREALIRHGGKAPGRSVAGGAVVRDGSVGRDATELAAAALVFTQSAGAEHASAEGKHDGQHEQHRRAAHHEADRNPAEASH